MMMFSTRFSLMAMFLSILSIEVTAQIASEGFGLTALKLVDTRTGAVVSNLTGHDEKIVLDSTSEAADYWTVVAETTDGSGRVRFNLDDGGLVRVQAAAPYALAGKETINGTHIFYPSAHLKRAGDHILSVSVYDGVLGRDDEISDPLANSLETHLTAASADTKSGDGMFRRLFSRNTQEVASVYSQLAIEFTVTDGSSSLSDYTSSNATNSNNNVGPADSDVHPLYSTMNGLIQGELRKYHKLTLAFDGPIGSERGGTLPNAEGIRAPNLFADYRMEVSFHHPNTTKTYTVPGYFAADGNAANSGASQGFVWAAHFRPTESGEWLWTARFKQGKDAATTPFAGSSAGYFDGYSGSFRVGESDKTGRDFRGKGMLVADEGRYKFDGSDEYFFKVGPESTSNLLAYTDFDGFDGNCAPNGPLNGYSAHANDYNTGDPTWAGGRGKEIIGAINYLAEQGINSITLQIHMDLQRDGGNVFPFVCTNPNTNPNANTEDLTRFDVSKLDQWSIVLDWAEQKGIAVQIKLEDDFDYVNMATNFNENTDLLRKLYYREMSARFGHYLGVTWHLGDSVPLSEVVQRTTYMSAYDAYSHPLVLHTRESDMSPLLQMQGSKVSGVALESVEAANVYHDTLFWVEQSMNANNTWLVSSDKQGTQFGGALVDPEVMSYESTREDVLWGNFMAGGSGVHFYFGASLADQTVEDFGTREALWTSSKALVDFVADNSVPLGTLSPATSIVDTGAYALSNQDSTYIVVYKTSQTDSVTVSLDAAAGPTFSVEWFNPRTGGALTASPSVVVVEGTELVTFDSPPGEASQDWVLVLKSTSAQRLRRNL